MPTGSGSPSFTSTSGKTGLSEHPDSPTQSGYFTTAKCSCQRTSTPAGPWQEAKRTLCLLVHQRQEFVAGGDGAEGEDGGGLLLGVIGAAHQRA